MTTTTTKVIFNVDKKVKERAMKRIKSQGITMSYCLSKTLADIASGKKVFEIEEYDFPEVKPTKAEIKAIESGLKEFERGEYITADELFKKHGYKPKR